MKKDENIEEIVKLARSQPITRVLYDLKERGIIPYISVFVKNDGEVTGATLHTSELVYYFHGTTDHNGKRVEVYKEKLDEGTAYEIPFDGWDI